MQGAKFLKVTGILMIIFGALAIVMDLIAMAGLGVLAAIGAPMGALWLSAIVGLVGAVLELVAGINGVLNAEKSEKAKTCMVWGIIVAGMCVLSNLITLFAYPANFSIVSLLLGLVIPALFIFGAYKNQNS
ncbi:MAG: hypothetical protein ACI4HO_01700 [Ruminococcus sp.]